jgi:dTDP-4-dehydrorhamnose reductase
VNCGAYTAVDRAETEQALAYAVNTEAPRQLAMAAAAAAIPIIQLSTDYVFPADGTGPWREDDTVNPASVYGQTKADGEAAVRASGARYAIVRTAWVISAHGKNFVRTMLRLGAEREELRVLADQVGTPTHADDLALAVSAIAARLSSDAQQPSGTWHCANAGETSWHGLAVHVFTCAAEAQLPVPRSVMAIGTAEYATPAHRPRDSRLDTSALVRDFDIRLRPWQDAVEELVKHVAAQGKRA